MSRSASRVGGHLHPVEDIVGPYVSPPERALVLCCDEKSQVQALYPTQPGLPLKKGRAQAMTHDYKRHGTTTLFAALNVLDGQVIGQCQQRASISRSSARSMCHHTRNQWTPAEVHTSIRTATPSSFCVTSTPTL